MGFAWWISLGLKANWVVLALIKFDGEVEKRERCGLGLEECSTDLAGATAAMAVSEREYLGTNHQQIKNV